MAAAQLGVAAATALKQLKTVAPIDAYFAAYGAWQVVYRFLKQHKFEDYDVLKLERQYYDSHSHWWLVRRRIEEEERQTQNKLCPGRSWGDGYTSPNRRGMVPIPTRETNGKDHT